MCAHWQILNNGTNMAMTWYQPWSKGDNTFGSICLCVCLRTPAWRGVVDIWVCSACRVLREITMTHGIQPKISVCLSVIRKRSRSRAAHIGRGAFNLRSRKDPSAWNTSVMQRVFPSFPKMPFWTSYENTRILLFQAIPPRIHYPDTLTCDHNWVG